MFDLDKKKSHEIFCVFSRYRRGKNWLYNRELRTTAVAKLNSTDYFQCSQTPVYSFGSNYFANYIHGRRRQLQKQLCSIFFSNSPIRAREHTHRRVDDKWKCASLETVFFISRKWRTRNHVIIQEWAKEGKKLFSVCHVNETKFFFFIFQHILVDVSVYSPCWTLLFARDWRRDLQQFSVQCVKDEIINGAKIIALIAIDRMRIYY